ncbi:MAG: acetylxylan esterase [Lentisphaeria bacterium]|nr:acetylxylan esterase [Lentisphaeria bacterium]
MKKLFVLLLLLTVTVVQSAEELRIYAKAEKTDCLFKTGENAVFNIQVLDKENKVVAGKKVEYLIVGERGFQRQRNSFVSGTEPQKFQMTLKQPGFIRFLLWFPETPRKRTELGAGFSPEKITPGGTEPADFDQFWAQELAKIKARLPEMKVTCKEFPAPVKYQGAVRCFDVRMDNGELVSTGFLAIPADAQNGKHPIIMCFNGAGKIGADLSGILNQARVYKSIVFNMNLHGTKNLISKEEAKQLRNDPMIYKYWHRDADSIEKYGTGMVFRRVLLTREYLKTRPEWDGETIIARGGSMGGAQAIVASANEPKMKFCFAGAPAMCDHFGHLQQRTSGWPGLFREEQYKTGAKHDAAVKVMPYFDVTSFAKRVKCKTVVSVGFVDYVCPPGSIYAAYNVLGSQDKFLYTVPRGNHGLNLDPESKAPGVFSYGGGIVQRTALDAYRKAMQK